MTREVKEITVGGAILGVLALLFAFNYGGRDITVRAATNDYLLKAVFNRVDGLSDGGEVHLAGIRVGTVEHEFLDKQYRAIVTLRINGDVKLPTDTSAAIHTDGLFGSKYVVLEPGGDMAYLKDGDEITFTQDSMVVGDLLDLIIAQGKARAAKREQEEKAEGRKAAMKASMGVN